MYIIRHLARRLRTLRGMTIVHVGAHYGEEAEQYQRWGAARVVWIEADPALLPALNAHLETVRALPPSRFVRLTGAAPTEHIVLNALVADTDGMTMTFRMFSNRDSNSIFAKQKGAGDPFPHIEETGEVVELQSRQLDVLLEENGIAPEEVDVLAMDIQGAELLCLKGAPRLVAHVPFIESEVSQTPFYDGGVLLPELDAWLEARGFRRRTWVRRRSMNAVYARV